MKNILSGVSKMKIKLCVLCDGNEYGLGIPENGKLIEFEFNENNKIDFQRVVSVIRRMCDGVYVYDVDGTLYRKDLLDNALQAAFKFLYKKNFKENNYKNYKLKNYKLSVYFEKDNPLVLEFSDDLYTYYVVVAPYVDLP